jgi:hypothetical protein
VERQTSVDETSITLEGFTLGVTYTFRVKSRNAFDFSVGYSNEVSILAARNPWQPSKPTTTFDRDLQVVLVDWNVPAFDGGSPVTAYKVLIRQENLIYSEEQVNCDGSQS